jgi:hypothetical protein
MRRYTPFLYYRVLAPEVLELEGVLLGNGPWQLSPTRKVVQMVGEKAFNMPEAGTQTRATEAKRET